ncbi:MAG: DUF1656 domain-containing protein [Sphingomonas taxi]|uniref:DUF1656 domain-containing protein n=1 Tax=Sphingomonas taxi TaxID=1549858 RepID=A0A2W5RF00_9SPHN|nr:MAG: DUF1656 domain-containing protein [Sphingomonas taxi]
MIGEINVAGVFVSPLLPCMLVAFVVHLALSRLLARLDAYRFVWNRPLFDLSLYLILLGSAFTLFVGIFST